MIESTDELLVEVIEGVAVLTLNRPDARNALNPALREALLAAVRAAEADDDVRAVLVTGAGTAFCAGADLAGSSLGQVNEPDFDPRSMSHALKTGANAIVIDLWRLDKPTIAAVNGAAVGPGAHIALACDFVLVSPETKFIWSFAKLGLNVDAGGAYLLPRLVGLPRARELVMLGGSVAGDDAVADGLAYQLVPAADLYADALALARRLAAGPTRALGRSKRLLNESLETALDDTLDAEATAQALTSTTADVKEGLAAAKERRDPKFQGR